MPPSPVPAAKGKDPIPGESPRKHPARLHTRPSGVAPTQQLLFGPPVVSLTGSPAKEVAKPQAQGWVEGARPEITPAIEDSMRADIEQIISFLRQSSNATVERLIVGIIEKWADLDERH